MDQMDALTSSFGDSSLGGQVKKLDGTIKVYISEISSPTRLWIQLADSQELDKMTVDMQKFYQAQGDGFFVRPDQVQDGMKVAAFGCGQWDRAVVIGEFCQVSEKVKLFFIDYGTAGYLPLKLCRFLIEPFSMMSRKAIRGGLFGITPRGNVRLWDLNITTDLISSIKNKVQLIKIMKHQEHEDFYEFLLYDTDGSSINEKFIKMGLADPVMEGQPNLCLSYPPFKMLEKSIIYPTYSDRIWAQIHFDMNLNVFEEIHIPTVTNTFAFEKCLIDALKREELKKFNEIFMKLREI